MNVDTDHMTRSKARAVRHQFDPLQMHLTERHWGPDTPHPHAGGGSR